MDNRLGSYVGDTAASKSPYPPAPSVTDASVVQALRAELSGLEELAGYLADGLHAQADRLLGPEPVGTASSAQMPNNAPEFVAVNEQLIQLRQRLFSAQEAARRLRKIG